MIEIEGKGDHTYREEFETEEEAYDFLWTLVGKVCGFFCAAEEDESLYAFDIEDDLIIWRDTDGKERYCAGWHWRKEQRKDSITMSNGRTLYAIFLQVATDV